MITPIDCAYCFFEGKLERNTKLDGLARCCLQALEPFNFFFRTAFPLLWFWMLFNFTFMGIMSVGTRGGKGREQAAVEGTEPLRTLVLFFNQKICFAVCSLFTVMFDPSHFCSFYFYFSFSDIITEHIRVYDRTKAMWRVAEGRRVDVENFS